LRIRSWVNGELRQDGSTAEMFHSIPDQLAWLTEALTLAPGDVLSTGTPLGHPLVQPGDVVRGEIEGLGVVENKVVLDD
jgi:2-keto-4-pentenoate hydratase/2-oxohepta-3-ene-1,7-dioic acid hydratase in catechol pathway